MVDKTSLPLVLVAVAQLRVEWRDAFKMIIGKGIIQVWDKAHPEVQQLPDITFNFFSIIHELTFIIPFSFALAMYNV